ncbi:MAG: MATE family efflux transporter [Clostridia bacterium]|nr:MATE family efflux transporter [Clostridia bacterium]
MLNGPVLPRLLSFALPLMLSSMLQLTFNAADVIVVGRFEGDAALAAVGAPGSLINLLVNLFLGLSVGANVVVAQCCGAGDYRQTGEAVHTAVALSLVGGVLVGVFGFLLAGPLLGLMGTPAEVLPLATSYMRIYFLGMPANMLYNFGAAILRAIGDTRRPLAYLTLAGVVNVVLNLLFVIAFHMGVSGVALATIISQLISATLVTLCLIRTDGAIHLDVRRIRLHPDKVWRIARVGLPAGLQGMVFSLSNVLIQSTVNSFGKSAVAGNTTASNLEGYIYVAMNSIHQGAITFTGQNVGARKYDRIPKVCAASLVAVTGIGLALGGFLMLAKGWLFRIYTNDDAVIAAAGLRSGIIAPTYFLCGMMEVMVGLLRGMGSSVTPMVVSILGACVLRIVWILTIYPLNPTLPTLYLSYPVSWFITFAAHTVCYVIIRNRKYK